MPILPKRSRLSKVNARRLLDDLASSYTHSLEETVIVEAIANSLDAGASHIDFTTERNDRTFTIDDDGLGMDEEEFGAYHDLAESRKKRGGGIGFAGLGAKLAHKLSDHVRTDTRSEGFNKASDWYWKGDDLEFRPRRNRRRVRGTTVSLLLTNENSALLEPDWIESALRRHYAPLLDPDFSQIYIWNAIYPTGVEFRVNGARINKRPLMSRTSASTYREINARRGGKVIGRAFFAISDDDLPEDQRGVALTTRGKVIRRSPLGMSPRDATRITGWAEIPDLVACLTLNKQDFLDHGALGQQYRRLREQVQKEYSKWLGEVGQNIAREEAQRAPRSLERELAALARSMPEINYLFARRRSRDVPVAGEDGTEPASPTQGSLLTGGREAGEGESENQGSGPVPTDTGPEQGESLTPEDTGKVKTRPRRRTSRQGPSIRLVSEPDRPEMSWLEAESILINTAHGTYVRAQRENQVRYHRRMAALIALCDGAEGDEGLGLLRRVMARWGQQ